MNGPDYTWWHGIYDVAKHTYFDWIPELKEVVHKKDGNEEFATAMLGIPDPTGSNGQRVFDGVNTIEDNRDHFPVRFVGVVPVVEVVVEPILDVEPAR